MGQQLVRWRVRSAAAPLPEPVLADGPPEATRPAPKRKPHPRSKKRKRARSRR
jgi:hypothetical protein